MNLAVIPARSGSKRIPGKNIRLFAGKPMLAYAVEAARASGFFERVIVSTDSETVADVGRAFGAEIPFLRPPELADDHTPTLPVIRHAIETCDALGWGVTRVCCIYPAVPFIRATDIGLALEMLNEGNGDYVFPVTAFPSPIQRAFKCDERGQVTPFNASYVSTRTQDLEPAYHDAGQFYWGHAKTWRASLDIHTNGRAIVLPHWRVVDIDMPADWTRAEMLYRALAEMADS